MCFSLILLLSIIPAQGQAGAQPPDDAATYMTLACDLAKLTERAPELRAALERGLKVAVRDSDLKRADWFGTRLKAWGDTPTLSLLGKRSEASRNTVVVPGGTKALMFVAHGREPGVPERFFAEYARTVLTQFHTNASEKNEVVERIGDHFERVQALEALGTRSGLRVTISLSTRDEHARQHAAQVLELLGWVLQVRDKRVKVAAAEKGSKSQRQITASALDLDEVTMQSTLQDGGVFDFAITDEAVPAFLGESGWLEQPRERNYIGGFAEALARNPELARTYVGLSELDDESVAALLSGVGLRSLLEHYSEALYYFSSALAAAGGRVLLPGGEAAAPVWSSLVKADPLNPAQFFSTLLKVDEGRLLAYFFAVSQLDWAHQQFCTRSASRISRFYDLFRNSIGVREGVNRGLRESPFADFLSDVPLDDKGRVAFPGGPEIWLLAKGHGSVAAAERMLRRVAGTAAPQVEDDILIRLARTRYNADYTHCSELDNFLAVARVESHRTRPLDARTALLLAQQFSRYRTIWPYFSVFTGLGYEEYSQFFALGERLSDYPRLRANDCLGQLGSLLEILSLFCQSGRIGQEQATEVFRLLCTRFTAAQDPVEFAVASLDVTRELLKAGTRKDAIEDPDAVMMQLLTGSAAPFRLEWKLKTYQIDNAAVRRLKYERVLQSQKVPSLQALCAIFDSGRELSQGKGSADELITRIETAAAKIPIVDIPEDVHFPRDEAVNLEALQPRDLPKLVGRLKPAAATRGALSEVMRELLEALVPQVRLALSGAVYAYYLDPGDLLVSDDPLFLRKHQFVSLRLRVKPASVYAEHKLARDETSGSNLVGSFAGFGLMAGHVASVAVRQNSGGSEFYAAAQLGALRITSWDQVSDGDLRLVGLKVRSSREWIVQAALDPNARSTLSQATLGLLSLTRRSHLLRSLDARDWDAVWRTLTLSDLYHLGDEFLVRYPATPWPSPTLDALYREANGRRLDWLGQDLQEVIACSHPHLVRLQPYESYERHLLPGKLAERASELKLYVAEFLDRVGLPARAAETVSEPLARALFQDLELTDRGDWRAVLDAFSRLDESMIERVISKPWAEKEQ